MPRRDFLTNAFLLCRLCFFVATSIAAFRLKILKDGGFRGWIMVDEWEVPDPYDACIKCKSAIDLAW